MLERNRLGLEYPDAQTALIAYQQLLTDMAERLNHTQWLAGQSFSLAECALVPYVQRLQDLALCWLWTEDSGKAGVADWFDRCRERPSFNTAISSHIPPGKAEFFYKFGLQAQPQARKIIGPIAQ